MGGQGGSEESGVPCQRAMKLVGLAYKHCTLASSLMLTHKKCEESYSWWSIIKISRKEYSSKQTDKWNDLDK